MPGTKKNIVDLTRTDVDSYRRMHKLPLRLLADNVRSMQNIGALFRTSDSFLVEEFILAGISGTPPHPQISKSALGAEESVAWRYVPDALGEVVRLKEDDWKIYVLEQAYGSIPLQDLELCGSEKCLLIVGNEVEGVAQGIVDIADETLEIPMHGIKHSLNVAVSGGIALWEFYKRLIRI